MERKETAKKSQLVRCKLVTCICLVGGSCINLLLTAVSTVHCPVVGIFVTLLTCATCYICNTCHIFFCGMNTGVTCIICKVGGSWQVGKTCICLVLTCPVPWVAVPWPANTQTSIQPQPIIPTLDFLRSLAMAWMS